ncbi:MAG TPA: FkbM family methyltransferase [Ignavibacteriaceae bacterium]|nr:FkbM family methyltransferase [Ignavibacteriaceae bacterium]
MKNSNLEKIIVTIRPIWMKLRKFSPKGTHLNLANYRIKDPTVPKIDRFFARTRNKLDKPNYEENTIAAIRKYVKNGDRVTIVGGGYGITSIVAMELGGIVTVIEASKDSIQIIREAWNSFNLKGTLIHGFAGSINSIWGELGGANKIETIPDCDILELDCEGAEKDILSNLKIKPNIIIVESHGNLGSPSTLVKNQLKDLGYSILEEIAEDIDKDIIVITGMIENTEL